MSLCGLYLVRDAVFVHPGNVVLMDGLCVLLCTTYLIVKMREFSRAVVTYCAAAIESFFLGRLRGSKKLQAGG